MNDLVDLVPAERDLDPARAERMRTSLVEWAERNDEPEPRQSLPGRRLVAVAAAATVAAVGIVVGADALRPDSAYAGWTASPDEITGSELAALGEDCVASVQDAFPNAPAGLAPVLGDRRGDFETTLIASDGSVALCATWLGANADGVQQGNTLDGLVLNARLTPGNNVELLANPGQTGGDDAARVAFGLVSDEVASVDLLAEDGTELTASVVSGHFLGWWPSGADVEEITARDASGDVVQTLTPEGFDTPEAPERE